MPRRPGSIDVDQIDFAEAISQNVIFSGSVKFANLGPKGNPLVIDVDGQVSGSDFLTIDSTNNQVGVNTSSPKYILDIKTNNGGIRLGNTTNSGEKSSNIHFTELADVNGLNAYGFSLKYNASDNAFNVMRHNNNTSGVSVMNFSRAFGNVQIGDVDPSRFGGTGVPKLWVNADVSDRGIIRCSQHSADSDPPQFEISKARGTMESPAAVQSLDYIAQLRAMGHDGTNFQISSDLLWIASDDFTSTSRPSTLTIRTVASGTTSPAERMRVTHDGKVGIGTTSPSLKLDVEGDVRIDNHLALSCDGTSDPSLFVNHAHIYSKLVSGHAEIFVRDSNGNVTQISPHTPEGEWQYFSRNTKTGKVVRVNMEKMIRKLEEITGESFMEEWYEDIED